MKFNKKLIAPLVLGAVLMGLMVPGMASASRLGDTKSITGANCGSPYRLCRMVTKTVKNTHCYNFTTRKEAVFTYDVAHSRDSRYVVSSYQYWYSNTRRGKVYSVCRTGGRR
jgi:hypothetical protein